MVAIKNVCEGTEAQMHPDAPQGKDALKRARAKDTCGRGKVEKLGKTEGLCELTSTPALHGEIESGESGNEATPSLRLRRRGLRADISQQREKAIDQLVADAAERGDCVDRFYWMLVYDLEMAPMTSNLKQLTDLGLAVPSPDNLDERELHEKLWEVVESLGDLGVFLLHTDGLSDRELYFRLFHEILTEPVRDLPPTEGVSEFIDLRGGASQAQSNDEGVQVVVKVERDRFLPKPEGGEMKEAE
jgi:hypothetical protein